MSRFSFWGLFAVFGAIVLAYWFWMRRLERKEDGESDGESDGEGRR